MMYSLALLLLMSSFLIAQENNAKIYLKTGYITEGKIVTTERNYVRFKETFKDGTSRTNYFTKSRIFLFINPKGRVIVSNLSLREEFESNRAINYSGAEIDTSYLAIASEIKKVGTRKLKTKPLFNPDGRVGQVFLDVGWGTTFENETISGDEKFFLQDAQDFSLALGIPLLEQVTIFSGFRRTTSSETLGGISLKIRSNYIFVKARIYIFAGD